MARQKNLNITLTVTELELTIVVKRHLRLSALDFCPRSAKRDTNVHKKS